MFIKKFDEFVNEDVQSAAKDPNALRTSLMDLLTKSKDKITNGNVCIVKDGKKMKLSADVTVDRQPRYKKTNEADETTTAPTSNDINFVIKCDGLTEPIANYRISITGNDITLTDVVSKAVVKYNKMNMKYIPDQIQANVEKKFGKIQVI